MRIDPRDAGAWDWVGVERQPTDGAVRLSAPSGAVVLARDVTLLDGVLEADVAVPAARSFHGVAWRVVDEASYESFFVRPHQVGNPDAVQYTPVSNGVSSWQLYHGDGFWHPARFPVGDWLTLRVEFAGDRLRVSLDGEVVLPATRLRRPPAAGGVGLLVGGDDLLVRELRVFDEAPRLDPPPAEIVASGTIERWEVSEPFAEADCEEALRSEHRWTAAATEASGLLDLARFHRPREGADTVLVRSTIRSAAPRIAPLAFGYSDRAAVFLGGRALFRGDATYRSRDYRYLGSIGLHDTVYLPLEAGENELVVAVSETFGGWGVQARLG